MVLHPMYLWFNPEMQGPEEEESEGGGGVSKGCVVHCPGDQTHQQAHDPKFSLSMVL